MAAPDAHPSPSGLLAGSSTPAELSAGMNLLRDAGLRVTASRLAVLELVADSAEPLAHHEVADRLQNTAWNRSTLYRNLIDLTAAGLLVKTEIAGLARFERAGRHNACAGHPHFVCIDCGEVTHLDGAVVRVENAAGSAQPRAVTLGHVEVQLRGVCDACAPHHVNDAG